jgi:hypothetical protein
MALGDGSRPRGAVVFTKMVREFTILVGSRCALGDRNDRIGKKAASSLGHGRARRLLKCMQIRKKLAAAAFAASGARLESFGTEPAATHSARQLLLRLPCVVKNLPAPTLPGDANVRRTKRPRRTQTGSSIVEHPDARPPRIQRPAVRQENGWICRRPPAPQQALELVKDAATETRGLIAGPGVPLEALPAQMARDTNVSDN